jgi:hypothetical protein
VQQVQAMAKMLTVTLPDGSSIEIDQEDWPPLASSAVVLDNALPSEREQHLHVSQHADGRVLVYGTVKSSAGLTTAGEFVTSLKEIAHPLLRVSQQLGLTEHAYESCLEQLARR